VPIEELVEPLANHPALPGFPLPLPSLGKSAVTVLFELVDPPTAWRPFGHFASPKY